MVEVHIEKMYKANMKIVDNLLRRIPDWEKVVLSRHIKFIQSYIDSNYDLYKVAYDFNFTYNDMLSIFWRIQKALQKEHRRRLSLGTIDKQIMIVKCEKSCEIQKVYVIKKLR